MSKILDLIHESQSLIFPLIEGDEVQVDTKVQKVGKRDKDKKDNTEVVSVEDALFPNQGTNKEQVSQKIISKINELIEGRATLADLIQLVKQCTKKVRIK